MLDYSFLDEESFIVELRLLLILFSLGIFLANVLIRAVFVEKFELFLLLVEQESELG